MMRKLFLQPSYGLSVVLAFAVAVTLSAAVYAAIPAPPPIGHSAPSFNLPEAGTAQTTSLKALEQGKKATVVIFVSTRCPVSNAYTGRMGDLARRFAAEGISFIGIDSNQTEPIAECASWAVTSKLGFPVLKDENSTIANDYGATHTPEVYVIDSSGKLVYHGRIDSSMDPTAAQHHDLADALNDILAGKPIANSETKAFGCSIKRPGGF